MDWRTWIFTKLQALAGGRVFSTLESAPDERPFIVIRMGQNNPEVHSMEGAQSQICLVWCYDDSGSYTGLDVLLKQVRDAVMGPVAVADAISAVWLGDSSDLPDDEWGVVTRYATFRLVGRRV